MRLLLLTLLLLSPIANAEEVSIICDTSTAREDGTAILDGGIVSHQFYDQGVLLQEATECAYSYDATPAFHSYQQTATDKNGVVSALSTPLEINLSPPLAKAVEVTVTFKLPTQ